MKAFILSCFFASSLAFGGYDGDYPDPRPDPYPDNYSCTLNLSITAQKEFRTRADAQIWCASITNNEDYCTVEKKGRYKFLATFDFENVFKYESDSSYSDARSYLFESLWNYVETNKFYNPIFQINIGFEDCGF